MRLTCQLLCLMSVVLLHGCDETPENRLTGYVEADYVYVAAIEAGWLEQLVVKEGDNVSEGQLLFTLDTDKQQAQVKEARGRLEQAQAQVEDMSEGARPDEIDALKAQLSEAEAGLKLAQTERDRWQRLSDQDLASKERSEQAQTDYQKARARVENIQAQIRVARLAARDKALVAAEAARDAAAAGLEQARWQLQQRTVKARCSGRVEEIFHRKGELVNPGAAVLSILPEDALKVRFFIPEEQLSALSVGDKVTIRQASLAEPLKVAVTYIAEEVEFTPPVIYSVNAREKLVFMAEARLPPGSDLRPGQPVDVVLP